MRPGIIAVIVAGITLASCDSSQSLAPIVGPTVAHDQVRPASADSNRYIVVYKASVTDTRTEIARHVATGTASVERVFDHALHGWAGTLSDAAVQQLRADQHVAFIERDAVVTLQNAQTPTPSWGLDRIDQRALPLDQTYNYTLTGAGVHFYGIDTGILYSHVEFGGRASFGADFVSEDYTAGVDCAGHGTHTAATAAGSTYGVAKGMSVVGVRVLDCNGVGYVSQIIAGVDWVTQYAIKPAVANMSLGAGYSPGLDQAVSASIASGVVYAIAAGNSNDNACGYSPADVPTAITVSASDNSDNRASFSSYGTCTDIFAPGLNITSAWIGSNTATNTISGTSMATPHVAGAAGLYLQANPTATPAQVAAALTANATSNVIINAGTGSPNKLLYTGFISPNQPPTAAINAPAANASMSQGASVTFTGTGNDPEDGPLAGASLVWTSSINGPIGTGTTFSTTGLSVGTHTITLVATDSKGATGTATRSVTITASGNQPPTTSITAPASNTSVVQGTTVTFTGSGNDPEDGVIGGSALTWSSSINGPIGSRGLLSTAALSIGTHTITLTARDSKGATGAATITLIVTSAVPVNQPPTASISAPGISSSFTAGASITFTGSGADPEDGTLSGGSLVWTSSINGQVGTGASFSTSVLSIGTHTITLTAKDSKGATGTASRTVTITAPNLPPAASITAPANNGSAVQGTSVTFAGNGSDPEDGTLPGASLVWTSSINGQIGTGASFSISTLSVGTHTITLTATDSKGATGTATHAITITAPLNQPPAASITAPASNASFVQGSSVSFSGSGNDPEDGTLSGASLVWTSSINGQIGTGTSFSTTSLSVGTHTVTLTAKDSKGATATATRSIIVTAPGNQPPTAKFTFGCAGMRAHQCQTDGTTSTDDAGVVQWSWAWGDGKIDVQNVPVIRHTWAGAGTYTVTLTVTDGGGLTSSTTTSIVVP